MRVLPRLNEDVNEEWISDKTRHACRRPAPPAARPALCAPRRQAAPATWAEAFAAIAAKLRQYRRRQIGGDRRRPATPKSMKALRPVRGARRAQPRLPPGRRQARWRAARQLALQPDIRGIDAADAILLVGTNPRCGSAGAERAHPQALAARRRARSASSARTVDLTYPVRTLGAGPATLARARRRQARLRRRC